MISKSDLRKEARARRQAHGDIGPQLAAHAGQLRLKPGALIGGYHALAGEADPALLLRELSARGHRIAFPRIAGRGLPLDFHLVPDGEALVPGAYGIHEPLADWPGVMPHILLVPLLGFDEKGHRLGYGGGFYDRTIAAFGVPAIGIAHAGQQMGLLPVEAHDMALDGILTEQGLRLFR